MLQKQMLTAEVGLEFLKVELSSFFTESVPVLYTSRPHLLPADDSYHLGWEESLRTWILNSSV